MKIRDCSLCKKPITQENAVKQSNKKDGVSCWCKECHRAKQKAWRDNNPEKARERVRDYRKRNPLNHRANFLRKRYGIEQADYDELLLTQNGRCAICGTEEDYPNRKWLCVDHVEGTLLIRGILCNRCNSAIGLLDHDFTKLQNAIEYLQREPALVGMKYPQGVHRSR